MDAVIIDIPEGSERGKQLIDKICRVQRKDLPPLLIIDNTEPVAPFDAMIEGVSFISKSSLRQSVLYGYLADLTEALSREDFASRENVRDEKISQESNRLRIRAKRILVAEDNAINQRVAISMLDRPGQGAQAPSFF